MLDRSIAPEIRDIESIDIRKPQQEKLSNGTPVFVFDVIDQDFIKVELNFDAGSAHCSRVLIANVTNKLLTEGTRSHSAAEIANLFESYGAFVETSITKDIAVIGLYTLNKYLAPTLELLAEIIREPVFDQRELDIHLAQKRDEFMVSMERVNYIAGAIFPSLLFGREHPYGRVPGIGDFDKVKREQLIDFHQEKYLNGAFRIMLAGKVSQDAVQLLDKYFGGFNNAGKLTYATRDFTPSESREHFIEKEAAVQNALRMGKLVVGRKHNDYAALRITNTILGGYFGSRLMTNIREDKGYTYGIGSGLVELRDAAYFYIISELKSEVTNEAIAEIIKEINKLQTEAVSDEELTLVRNYLQGEFQRSFDGPFALLSRFKEVYYSDLDYSYFEKYIEKVKTINQDEILHMANKYWNMDEMYRLVVGKN